MTSSLLKSTPMLATALFMFLGAASAADESFAVTRDVAYGPLERQKLDIYFPMTVASDTDVIVFFYGGSFQKGDKDSLKIIGRSFAEAGTIFVAPNFRNYPETVFPGFVEDAALAVSHVWKTFQEDGATRRIYLGGWSSGAYIAALVGIDERYLEAAGMPKGRVAGVVGLAGSYQGGLCGGLQCDEIFPDTERANWAVSDFLDESDPALLLIAAEQDHIATARDPGYLVKAARKNNVDAEILIIPDAYHRTLLQDMWEPDGATRRAIALFMQGS